MDYGFSLPTRGPLANPADILAMARAGEAQGFAWLAVSDHIVVPRTIGSRYPYSSNGAFPGSDTGECLEQLTLVAWIAQATTTAKLVTTVMVVPHRNPVHTAKIIASIDVLSGGRVAIGCGAGWMREEFEAIGTEPFDERGRVTNEYLEVFKELWTKDDPAYDGDYAKFADITFLPKPVQKPHPPFWIGGESGPALRRAVAYGDYWFPIGSNPKHPLNTLARYKDGVARMRAAAEEIGRDPAEIRLAFWANWYREDDAVTTDTGERHLLTGSAAQVAADARDLREAGVEHLLFNFQRADMAATMDAIQRFTDEVRPLIEG